MNLEALEGWESGLKYKGFHDCLLILREIGVNHRVIEIERVVQKNKQTNLQSQGWS